jgi:hypothetical protein
VDFNRRRKNHEFDNVNFRDKREYNKVSQKRETNQKYARRKNKNVQQQPKRIRSQVRIRNKQRNYGDKNFVHVNTKVKLNDYGINNYPGSNRHITQNNRSRKYVQHSGPSNYYSQRNIQPVRHNKQSPKKIYLDNLRIQKDPQEDDFDDEYFEERDPPFRRNINKKVAVKNTQYNNRNNYYKPQIISKHKPTEEVYHDTIIVNKDSEEEDYDDDYFEEKDAKRRLKIQSSFRQRAQNKNNRQIPQNPRNPPRRTDTESEEVYHDEIQIARSSKDRSEDYGDEYFEERDSHGWKQRNKIGVHSKPSEIKQHNYFSKKGAVNHNRQDSPERAYVDKIEIRKDSREEEDFDDDYFEERDSWKNRNKREKEKRNDNVFNSNYGNSNVNSKVSSGYRTGNNSGMRSKGDIISGRFNSFAPTSKQGSRIQYTDSFGPEVHYAQVESKTEMSPDPQISSRETKGPVHYNTISNRKDDKKTEYTSSTYHNSQYNSKSKKKEEVQFNNPYSAQIFTNEKTYVQNNKKNKNNKRQNTFTDYYQTDRQRF